MIAHWFLLLGFAAAYSAIASCTEAPALHASTLLRGRAAHGGGRRRETGLRLRGGGLSPQQKLWDAALAGDVIDVINLVKGGANPNACCSAAENMLEPNALQLACWAGHASIAEELVKLGANVCGTNKRGYTALHFAALQGHLEVCKTLVRLGADVGAKDQYGDQPVDRAEQAEEAKVMEWLEGVMKVKNIKRSNADATELLEELQTFQDDFEKSMMGDEGGASEFLPKWIKDEKGEVLPQHVDLVKSMTEAKELMETGGATVLNFECVQHFVERRAKLDAEAEELQRREAEVAAERAAQEAKKSKETTKDSEAVAAMPKISIQL